MSCELSNVYRYFPLFLQGALTHGDRRATESRDLSRYNIDNKVSPHMVYIQAHWLVDQIPV